MSSVSQYFKGLFGGIGGLLTGMSVTWKELFTKKITQQYPENRKTLVMSDRFRGELSMPHDENNEHACTSCGICEMNCPNGTIKVTSKMIQTEDGKKKKILDTYHYNLGMCTFCNLCVLTCPSNAIKFEPIFENAIFTRAKLDMRLNHEDSKLREKKKPEPKPVVEKPAVEKSSEVTDIKSEVETRSTPPITEKKPVNQGENKPTEENTGTTETPENKQEQAGSVEDKQQDNNKTDKI